ncbi:MAG: hypothetical protein WBC91_15860 [Phototrophicaceae bacterium]
MKNKRSLFVFLALFLLTVSQGHLFAQATSVGCTAWDNLSANTLTNPGTFSLNNQVFDAGDVVEATFTLNTATSATVNLETPSATIRDSASFTSGSVTVSYTIPSDSIYSIIVRNTGASNGSVNVSFSCTPAPVVPPVTSGSASVNPSIVNNEIGFIDERINYRDAAAPIAIYSYMDSSGAGFDIYKADGTFAYRATASDLRNVPLYDSVNDIRISSIAGGGYQITAPQYNGKTYVMQVGAPYAHIGYTSWEQE